MRYDRNTQEGLKIKNISTLIALEPINGLPINYEPRIPKVRVQELELSNIDELIDFIDWTPFFKTWMLTGKYPAILQDKVVENKESIVERCASHVRTNA